MDSFNKIYFLRFFFLVSISKKLKFRKKNYFFMFACSAICEYLFSKTHRKNSSQTLSNPFIKSTNFSKKNKNKNKKVSYSIPLPKVFTLKACYNSEHDIHFIKLTRCEKKIRGAAL